MARSNVALALILLAALATSCGGSGGSSPTPTPTAIVSPTAMPLPTESSTFIGAPTGLSKLTFIDPQRGWAIGACPKTRGSPAPCDILATDDGGRTWRTQYHSFDTKVLAEIQFLDAQHGFVTSDTVILATSDGGATWKQRDATQMRLDAIKFVTPERGFAISPDSGVVFQTTDGGTTWVFAYGRPRCGFSSISFPGVSDGWVAGYGEGGPCLYQSTDGGMTWSLSFEGAAAPPVADAFQKYVMPRVERSEGRLTASGLTPQLNDQCRSRPRVRFVNPTDGWLVIGCYSGGSIVMSTNSAGRTWRYVWGLAECLMGCNAMTLGYSPVFFLDEAHVWRFGPGEQGVTVQASADAGVTWAEPEGLGEKCCYGISSAFFVDAAHGWFVSGDGTLDVTSDGGLTWSPLEITIEP